MNDSDQFPTPPSGTPRPPGRARQRIQQRRQARTQRDATEPRRSQGLSQLAPSGSLKLPKVQLPRNLYPIYVIGGVLFVVLVVYVLGRLRQQEPERPPNAIWIGTEWTYETQTEETVAQLVERLRDHKIGTVYAWLSWLQADQTWRGADNFENVKDFVQQFNQLYPEAELMAWIGFPVDAGQGYRLDQPDLQAQTAEFSKTAVNEFGFDGIFLNVEPVFSDDQNFLAMLRQVRASLPEGAILAAAIPPDWSPINADIPVPPLIAPGTEWSEEYKQNVALLLDQMAIMAYNSGLSSPSDYSLWTAYQVKAFAQAIDALNADLQTQLLIGVPTYEAEPPGHDPLVENVISASDGLRLGIQQAGDAAHYVRGAAIYAGWETDDEEWAQFDQAWARGQD